MVPNEKDLKIFMNYRRMKEIKRCNNFPVINQEDVAQHSFYTTLLAMTLADEYNTWAADANFGYHPFDVEHQQPVVNTEVVVRKALLHDLEESFTSDIPWNIKHMTPEVHETLTKAIEQKINSIYEGSQTMEMYHEINRKCKDGFEGEFVNLADMLELGIYCWEEYIKGNHYLKSMLDKCIYLIKSYKLCSTLEEASPMFQKIMNLLQSSGTTAEELMEIN